MSSWFSVEKTIATHARTKYSDADTLRKFCELNGFTRAACAIGNYDPSKVLRTGRIDYKSEDFGVPYLDHGRYFKNPGTKTICLVSQPYQNASDIREEVEEWAHEHGLKAELYDYGWYYPGSCCCIVFSLPDVEIKFPEAVGQEEGICA